MDIPLRREFTSTTGTTSSSEPRTGGAIRASAGAAFFLSAGLHGAGRRGSPTSHRALSFLNKNGGWAGRLAAAKAFKGCGDHRDRSDQRR